MNYIAKYAKKSRFTTAETAFTEVDSLVLTEITYMYFDGLIDGCTENSEPHTLRELLTCNDLTAIAGRSKDDEQTMERDAEHNEEMLCAVRDSVRFSEIEALWYVSELDAKADCQFGAMTFFLPDGTAYIAYRGTDKSFAGWKEDFNMAWQTPVPSQKRALEYLIFVAEHTDRPIRLGGHSKGGNLAVYAAMFSEKAVRCRIKAVYDHDGPGFLPGIFDNNGYRDIKERIYKTVPGSSMIGMLLEGHDKYKIIESNNRLIMQHDPYSWKIVDGAFVQLEYVSNSSKYFSATLDEWLTTINDEDRERFSNALFGILESCSAQSFIDISENRLESSLSLISAYRECDPQMRSFIHETLFNLAKISVRNLMPKFPEIKSPKDFLSDVTQQAIPKLDNAKKFLTDRIQPKSEKG